MPVNAYRHKYLSSLLYLSNAAVRMMEIGDGGDPTAPVVEDPYAEKLGISLEPLLSQRDDITVVLVKRTEN